MSPCSFFFFFYVSKVLGAMEAQESMPTLRINIMKSCNGSLTTLCQKPAVQHKGILLCLSTALLVTKNLTRGKCSQAPCNKPCPIQLLQTSSGSWVHKEAAQISLNSFLHTALITQELHQQPLTKTQNHFHGDVDPVICYEFIVMQFKGFNSNTVYCKM